MNEKLFEAFDINELLVPTDNSTVKMNMYWVVQDEKVFRHRYTKVWQCNKNESLVKQIYGNIDGVEIRLLPYAYVKE